MAVALLAALVGALAVNRGAPGGDEAAAAQDGEAAPVPVELLVVEAKELAVRHTVTGQVTPRRQATIAFKVGGTVAAYDVEVGDRVEEGQRLARLDATELELNRRQAAAGLAAAKAALARLRAGASEEELRQVEAAVAQAAAELERAESAVERARQLRAASAITEEQLENAELGLRLAKAGWESAQAAFANVRAGARAEDIRAAEAQRDQAQVALEFAEQQLADAELHAPIPGVVAARHIEVGQAVGAGTPAFHLVQLHEVLVDVGVSERWVNHLDEARSVEVHVDAVGRAFSGTIHSVSPVIQQPGRLYPVRILVPNADGALRPGMIATVRFDFEPLPAVSAVPIEAVLGRVTGDPYVYVAEETPAGLRARRRPVETGEVIDGWVRILSGLEPGERVIVSGQTLVNENDPIRDAGEVR